MELNSKINYNKILFEEIVNSGNILIIEKITKEQKEKGQRAIADEELNVFYQLRKWIQKRWAKKVSSKEELLQKKEEFNRLNYLLKLGEEISTESDKDISNYIKNITNNKPEWLALKSQQKNFTGGLIQQDGSLPYLVFGTSTLPKNKTSTDFGIKTDNKKLRKIIRKCVILHEYGHLFEFLKSVIITGEGSITDTINDPYPKIIDSEGKANAYAIDNIYRKDRRELLKNSEGYTKKELEKSFKNVSELKKGNKSKTTIFDLYKVGTATNSKKLKPTLDSIEKENPQ